MVTEVLMTVWIRLVQGSEKLKDQDVDKAHGKNEEVYSKGGSYRITIILLLSLVSIYSLQQTSFLCQKGVYINYVGYKHTVMSGI